MIRRGMLARSLAVVVALVTLAEASPEVDRARKAYEAARKQSGDDSLDAERKKLDLASTLLSESSTAEALQLFKELLASAENKHGADSADADRAVEHLISVYRVRRDYDALEPLFQRRLAYLKKHPTFEVYPSTLQTYGGVLEERGELSAAQRVYEQALKIFDDAKSPSANGLTMLMGLLYMREGQIPKAKAMWDRWIAPVANEPVMQRVTRLHWVAERFIHAGRNDLATPLTNELIRLSNDEIARIEKASGPDAKELGDVLFTLGWTLYDLGQYDKADAVLSRLVALQEKTSAPFVGYAQLASVRRALGKPREALALFEKGSASMAKFKSRMGNTGLYPMIADIERDLGNYKRAEQLYVQAQADLDGYFGKGAILVGRLHQGLAIVYASSHQLDKAERVLADNLDIAERELATVLATGTEADHVSYFAREQGQLDLALSYQAQIAGKRAGAVKLALTTLLRRKGRVLDAAAANLATIRGKLSPDDRKLLDELGDARTKLSKLAVAGPATNPDYAKDVAALEDQIRKLEVALAGKSAAYRATHQAIDLASVQKKLPRDARLVEIASYQPRAWGKPDIPKPPAPPRRYAAYVLAPTGDPVFVDLGEAQPIDDAIAKFRAAVASPDNDAVRDLGKALHELTFGKLRAALGPAKQVLIAPDGALAVVPFAALHTGKRFLVEDYNFTYLTSGRDLLRLGLRGTPNGGPVIFADPDFDGANGTQPAGRRSRAMTGLTWPRLPGTAKEADAIAGLTKATVYRDKAATETTIKSLHAPPVLHLATHGFFLTDDPNVDNPLLQSGLAFAGANKLVSGGDDGILTALEAAGLDLWGTRLVVLSACETGLGKVTNGDGVYGLRRALVIAGAESLVMSLWQVDDVATQNLMTGYYKRLEAGGGRSAALRDVQLELLKSPKYAHPFYWASFIPAGDSGPL
jgi:CHAT domain-containing protein